MGLKYVWLYLLLFTYTFLGLWPSIWSKEYAVFGLLVNLKNIVLLFSTYAIFMLQICYGIPMRRHCQFFLFWAAVLVIMGLFNIQYIHLQYLEAYGMRLTLVMFFSCLLFGCTISSISHAQNNETLVLKCIVYATVGISSLYTLESLFKLGLSTKADTYDFGILRVAGPLFIASTGPILLMACLGACLYLFKTEIWKKWIWGISTGATLCACLGTGSRGGLVCMITFMGFMLLLSKKGVISKLNQMLPVILIGVLVAIPVVMKADLSRFARLEDSQRSETHLAILKLIGSNDYSFLYGAGYGSIWHWYVKDIYWGGIQYDSNTISNEYGTLLYHSHSVFLLCLAEFGSVGIFFFGMLLYYPMKHAWRTRGSPLEIFSAGILSSQVMFFCDLFLFKNWTTSAAWCAFYFLYLSMSDQNNRGSPEPIVLQFEK